MHPVLYEGRHEKGGYMKAIKGSKPKKCYLCKCDWFEWQRDIEDKKIYQEMKRFVDTDEMCNACLFDIADRLKRTARIFVKQMEI